MQKFYYILQENPHHPEMMYASSKQEVKSILMENLNSEDQILKILTEEELNLIEEKISPQKQLSTQEPSEGEIDPNNFSNSTDYFNDVIKQASTEKNNNVVLNQIDNKQPVQNNEEVKFFELNGEKLKLENGKIFKLNWRNLENNEIEQYRIINSKSKKSIKNDSYQIQKLDWIQIG